MEVRRIRDVLVSALAAVAGVTLSILGVARMMGRGRQKLGVEAMNVSGDADGPQAKREPGIEGQGPEVKATPSAQPATPDPQSPIPKEGWSKPLPEELPRPTYWPAVMALGIAFLMWGVVTSLIVSAVGLVLFAMALAGWIGEIRHEHGQR